MNRRNGIGIYGAVLAVIVAVVGVSVVWAGYTSNLNIKGSATAESAKWSVIFKDLGAAQKGNSNLNLTPTAVETATPTISGQTSISNFGISVKTPGDYVYYKFKIRNDGSFAAQIDDSFAMPTPSCSAGGTVVCSKLQYTLKYTDGTTVSKGNKFEPGTEKEVILRLQYLESSNESELPTTNITISNLDITIPFKQV